MPKYGASLVDIHFFLTHFKILQLEILYAILLMKTGSPDSLISHACAK